MTNGNILLLIFILCSFNIYGYEMVSIPKGEFTLSIPLTNSRTNQHVTKHFVFKKGFLIGKYEVTNKMWNDCYLNKGCKKRINFKKEDANHPVVRVSWPDASEFIKWYSKRTGKNFRLPKEEEWAYAMNNGRDLKEVAKNYDYSDIPLDNSPLKKTHPKGTFGKNNWGVFDLKGNVWEWTLSCWYASKNNILKDRTTKDLLSRKTCTTRIAQGETRSHIPDFISTTYSGGCSSIRPAANLGFRLLLEKQ